MLYSVTLRPGIEPATFWLPANPLHLLSYCRPNGLCEARLDVQRVQPCWWDVEVGGGSLSPGSKPRSSRCGGRELLYTPAGRGAGQGRMPRSDAPARGSSRDPRSPPPCPSSLGRRRWRCTVRERDTAGTAIFRKAFNCY